MTYKTIVIEKISKTKKLAEEIENTANKLKEEGLELVTFSMINSSKAILVFKETTTDLTKDPKVLENVLEDETAEVVSEAE